MVDDGCQHQAERSKEHDDRDESGDLQGHRVLDDEEVMGGGAGPLGSVPPACFCVASTYYELLSPSPCFRQSLPDHLDDRGPPRLWDPA